MTTSDTPRPKPAPPKPKPVPTIPPAVKSTPDAKPKFVRKPHLTDKPFKAHEGIQKLAEALAKPIPEKKYPTPRRGQRRTNKEKK